VNRNHKAVNLFFFVILCMIICSCSHDYEEASLAEALSDEVPQIEMTGVVHFQVRNGHPEFVINADKALSYDKKNITELENVVFKEYDALGNIKSTGSGHYMSYDHESGNAEMTGDLFLDSRQEKTTLNAKSLIWTEENKLLSGSVEEKIILKKDDGNEMGGKGFSLNLSSKELRFDNRAEGIYFDE